MCWSWETIRIQKYKQRNKAALIGFYTTHSGVHPDIDITNKIFHFKQLAAFL